MLNMYLKLFHCYNTKEKMQFLERSFLNLNILKYLCVLWQDNGPEYFISPLPLRHTFQK